MAKLESNFRNMLLSLTATVLISGAILASLYIATKEQIQATKTAKQQNALKEVLPDFARLGDARTITLDGIGDFVIHRAYDDSGNFVGAAVESFSRRGYTGIIRIMVGFDTSGKIVDYAVLEQRETPGLGDKIIDWFRPQEQMSRSLVERIFGFEVAAVQRNSSIIGKSPSTHDLRVCKEGGIIDTMTAATISAVAFLEAVQFAYAVFTNNLDVIVDTATGATEWQTPERTQQVQQAVDITSSATEIE